MLREREHGYAVMNNELTSCSLEDANLETCKRYCRNGDVIARQTPYVAGFSIRIMWYKFNKPISFRHLPKNILWLHWSVSKEYLHKIGEIVYRNEECIKSK